MSAKSLASAVSGEMSAILQKPYGAELIFQLDTQLLALILTAARQKAKFTYWAQLLIFYFI
jgi:hypothetical protein